MKPSYAAVLSALALTTLLATEASAQAVDLPRVSQRAELRQTLGLTEIDIVYHRPLVGGREVWGALVPFDQVWRAGANENTTIAFSDDVKVEGQDLAAGTYGLYMIPTQDAWTVIFSKNHTSWGSFTYDPAEDALRVTVKPVEHPFTEMLTYDVRDADADSAVVTLAWEKLQVPFRVEVDTHAVTLASLRNQLRSEPGFTWMGWQQAANYCLQEEVNYEEALGWADTSIQAEEHFANLQTKAQLLDKTGDAKGSKDAMARAMEVATPLELHNHARQLLGQGDVQAALDVFELNAKRNPDTWFVEIGLARGYSAAGQFAKAADYMAKGAEKAPEAQREVYRQMAEQLKKGVAI